MKILVVRHGEAVSSRDVDDDSHRWLTEDGRVIVRACGAALADAGHVPTQIYASPYVRAMQTAELLAEAWGYTGEIVTHAPLVPGGPTARALACLDAHGDDDTVALVSHEPTVSAVTGSLMGIRYSGFPTAGVAILDGDASGAKLLTRLDPTTRRFY